MFHFLPFNPYFLNLPCRNDPSWFGTVRSRNYAGLLQFIHDPGGPVIADPHPSLQIGGRRLLVFHHNPNGFIQQFIRPVIMPIFIPGPRFNMLDDPGVILHLVGHYFDVGNNGFNLLFGDESPLDPFSLLHAHRQKSMSPLPRSFSAPP